MKPLAESSCAMTRGGSLCLACAICLPLSPSFSYRSCTKKGPMADASRYARAARVRPSTSINGLWAQSTLPLLV